MNFRWKAIFEILGDVGGITALAFLGYAILMIARGLGLG